MAHDDADQEDVETSRRRSAIAFTLRVLLSAVVMAVSTTVFSLFIWTVLPFAVGWSPSVIVTGSMEPSIAPGDIVVTAPIKPTDLRLGYVIRFRDPTNAHPYLMHRITEFNDDGTLVTKGDANQSEDSTPVPRENVTGVARLRVPVIGLPAVWLRNGQYLPLGLTLIGVAFAAQVLAGMRTLISSAAGHDEPPAEQSPQDMDLPDLEAAATTADTADGTAPVAVADASPTAPDAVPAVPAGSVPAPVDPDLTEPGPAGAPEPSAVAPVGARPPAGRHRGQGRASWRRERHGDRPRSRRLDRPRGENRADATARR